MIPLTQGLQLNPTAMPPFRRPKPGLFGSKRKGPGKYLNLSQGQDGQPIVPGSMGGFTGGDVDGNQIASRDGASVMGPQQPASSQQESAEDLATSNNPLGGSMRQPFDYERAIQILAGDQKKISPWRSVAAAVGDALVSSGGGTPWATRSLVAQRQDMQDRMARARELALRWQHDAYARQNEADLRAANPFTIGRDRVQFDPRTGETNVIYDGPDDFDLYANAMGLEPGTEDYFRAVEDYVLRSSGPSAYERDVQLDDHRTSNDASLENLRYGNRRGLEQLRQANRRGIIDYRNANPAPRRSRSSRSSDVVSVRTPAEAQRLAPGTRYRDPNGVVRER